MKKYLDELEKELAKKGVSESEIADILSDHKEMIEEAINQGLSESEIEQKFGNPQNIAEEVSSFSAAEKERKVNVDEYTLHVSYPTSKEFEVSINLINEDFQIVGEDIDNIEVYYQGKGDLSRYHFSFENNVFEVKEEKQIMKLFNWGRSSQLNFLFKLPKHLIAKCSLVGINADAVIKGIKMGDFSMKNTNGDLEIFDLRCENFKIDTVNGDTLLKRVYATAIHFVTVSGDVQMNHVECENTLSVNSVSGDLKIEESTSGDCSFHTVSGDVSGSNFYPKSVSLKSVSGDFHIFNEDSSRVIEIKSKKTVSGDIKIGQK